MPKLRVPPRWRDELGWAATTYGSVIAVPPRQLCRLGRWAVSSCSLPNYVTSSGFSGALTGSAPDGSTPLYPEGRRPAAPCPIAAVIKKNVPTFIIKRPIPATSPAKALRIVRAHHGELPTRGEPFSAERDVHVAPVRLLDRSKSQNKSRLMRLSLLCSPAQKKADGECPQRGQERLLLWQGIQLVPELFREGLNVFSGIVAGAEKAFEIGKARSGRDLLRALTVGASVFRNWFGHVRLFRQWAAGVGCVLLCLLQL